MLALYESICASLATDIAVFLGNVALACLCWAYVCLCWALCWAYVGRADVDVMVFLGTAPCACGSGGPMLGLCWCLLAICWAYWSHVGPMLPLCWGYGGPLLGPSPRNEHLENMCRCSSISLLVVEPLLGQCCPLLGICWAYWGHVRPMLPLCWGYLLGLCWPMWGTCWTPRGSGGHMLALSWASVGPGLPLT